MLCVKHTIANLGAAASATVTDGTADLLLMHNIDSIQAVQQQAALVEAKAAAEAAL